MPAHKVNLKDIAKKVGVSTAAVSYALRGNPRISEEMRKKIVEAAQVLGYRQDAKISELMSYMRVRKNVEIHSAIAVLQAEKAPGEYVEGEYYQTLLHSIRKRAESLGYHVDILKTGDVGRKGTRLLEILENRSIHGLIVPWQSQEFNLPKLNLSSVAVVTVSGTPMNVKTHHVQTSFFQGMTVAIEKLWSLGFKRIGLALDNEYGKFERDYWYGAFLQLMQQADPKDVIPILYGNSLPSSSNTDKRLHRATQFSKEDLLSWFKQHRPEVILGLALKPLQMLNEAGINVPKQVAYADLHWRPAYKSMEISGVDQHTELIGTSSVEMLVSLIQNSHFGIPEHPHSLVIHSSWVDGDTINRHPQKLHPDAL